MYPTHMRGHTCFLYQYIFRGEKVKNLFEIGQGRERIYIPYNIIIVFVIMIIVNMCDALDFIVASLLSQ